MSDMHTNALKRFEAAWEADRLNREDGRDDIRNLRGDQWSDEERRQREDDGRPCLTINRLPQQIRQVTGDLRLNRPAIKVSPVGDDGDQETAKLYAGLIRNIESRSKLTRPYVTAAMQAAQCGIGNFRVFTDYAHAETFEQDIFLEPIYNPFAVVWDPMARNATRSDALFCFVIEEMTREDFEAAYPKAQIASFDEGDSESPAQDWYGDSVVRVAEYWYKEPVRKTLARMPDGEIVALDDLEEWEREAAEMYAEETREIETHRVYSCKLSGLEIIEEPTEWLTPDIPIIAVTGEEVIDDEGAYRASVIRYAKDPQRMYNYWNSAQAEFVALQPKQPYIATAKQVAPFAKDWKDANRSNKPVLLYNSDGTAPPPQRQQPAVASPGMIQAMMQAADDIKATTGIYDAALGNRSNETSGVAIRQRQAEADISTFFISDNLALAVQQAGRILVDLIPRIYDTKRQLRIQHEDGSEKSVVVNDPNDAEDGPSLLNDLSVGKYDVDVDTGPSFSTQRQEAAESLIEFARVAPEARPLVLDLIAKNMNWPGAKEIADRLRKALPPGMAESDEDEMTPEAMQREQMAQQQAQIQMQQQALEMQKMQAEVAKLQADAADKGADTQKTRAETAQLAFEMAVQSGQLEQVVRQVMASEISALARQNSTAPTPGFGV